MKFLLLSLIACLSFVDGQELCQENLIGTHLILSEEEQAFGLSSCENCMAKHGVSFSTLLEIEAGKPGRYDRKTKCYYLCYFQAFGSFDSEGKLDLSILSTGMTEKNYNAVASCKWNENGPDLCENAFNMYTCFLRKIQY